MLNSDFLNGLEVSAAITKAIEAIQAKGIGYIVKSTTACVMLALAGNVTGENLFR